MSALFYLTVYNKSNVWSVSFDGPFFPPFPIDDVNPSKSENLLFLALCLSFVYLYVYGINQNFLKILLW